MLRVWKIGMEENIWFDKFRTFQVIGSFTWGESRKTCNKIMRKNAKKRKLRKDTGRDRNAWKIFLRKCQIHPKWKTCYNEDANNNWALKKKKNKAMRGNLSNAK